MNSTKSYFNNVEFTNTSEEGIYVTNEMPAASLVANGVIVTFADNSVLGWILVEDTDTGRELREQIAELAVLLSAYEDGTIPERG